MTFQVGDRVVVTDTNLTGYGRVGDVGTIVESAFPLHDHEYDVAVRFDSHPIAGHNLRGSIQDDNGLWLCSSQLRLLSDAAKRPVRSYGDFVRVQDQLARSD